MADRVQNRERSSALLNETLGSARPTSGWRALERAGVPAGRIKTVAEVCESPHLQARGMVVTLPHPKAGAITVMGVPIRLARHRGRPRAAPPLLGQHTEEILTRLLRCPAPAWPSSAPRASCSGGAPGACRRPGRAPDRGERWAGHAGAGPSLDTSPGKATDHGQLYPALHAA